MPIRVEIEITNGPMKGLRLAIARHDTLLFGSKKECGVCIADTEVSGYHCLLEANPPKAWIQDLGSRTGTYINGIRHGGREEEKPLVEGMRHRDPTVALADGDQIRVGNTVFLVRLIDAALCSKCDASIADQDRDRCARTADTFVCDQCRGKLVASDANQRHQESIFCPECGRKVESAIGARRASDICDSCREEGSTAPPVWLQRNPDWSDDDDNNENEKGFSIDGYEIESCLGKGSFGEVYLARQSKDDLQVAIKVMRSRIRVLEEARHRFIGEVDFLTKLRHRNIVAIFDHGSSDGMFYIVMEFCKEGSVDALLRNRVRGRLSLHEALPIMQQSLEGLAFVHGRQKIHRDLKPANILLSGSGANQTVKLCDFGLCKDFEEEGFSGRTVTGMVGGTPPFMPREQRIDFKAATYQSDIWSLGATFYQMLTGSYPRNFTRVENALEVILNKPIVPIHERDARIPTDVAAVIDRAISDEVGDRFQTAEQMGQALALAL